MFVCFTLCLFSIYSFSKTHDTIHTHHIHEQFTTGKQQTELIEAMTSLQQQSMDIAKKEEALEDEEEVCDSCAI